MDRAHASALEAKHLKLDRKVAEEIRRPFPDMFVLRALKKQKLKIKEALSRLQPAR